VLDFNDLQLIALRLLQQPPVVERLRREIRYLLVDEFQDTNPVQYALVQGLSAVGEGGNGGGPQVFLVGDPKQSIYGFRDADVRVFERARRELIDRNRQTLERGLLPYHGQEARDTGDIHLPVSFRLAPEVVAFVNRVAGCLFPQTPQQVAYEPLVCGRAQAQGTVRFVIALESAQDRKALGMSEEELLARLVLRWVTGVEPLTVGEWDAQHGREAQRPVRYGDIAVLARYRLGVPKLTAVLQRYRIPYVVHAGAGFFQTPEVQDLYFLLRFLLNDQDDLALAVTLRSPLFALSDGQLLHISLADGETLWEKLCHCAGQEGAPPALGWAVGTLKMLRLLSPRLSLSELIRTVGERTFWLLRLRNSPRFEQIQANVQKLLEFARSFQARGLRALADFVQELAALIETEAPETEAALPAGVDAVNVLTIHAAKGLEFPVVMLYHTAEMRSKTDLLLFDDALGPVVQPRLWDPESGIHRAVQTPAYVVANFGEAARREAEEQRVLYVGMTRARDHLVLSGTLRMTKDGSVSAPQGLLGFVLEGLAISPQELISSAVVEFSEDVEFDVDGERVRKPVLVAVPVVRDAPVLPVLPHR
ncbi:MAG: UvrD-helicase domain-containing protein, partial [Candidatus Kapabacteria bacterium]|nr:UvrD-helicase domain-containing protein [Candidatus Kapabacteria bacterium]